MLVVSSSCPVLRVLLKSVQGKGPKRVGALYVTCQLFKIYFKLGTVHLCRSVIISIELLEYLILRNFPEEIRSPTCIILGAWRFLMKILCNPEADYKLSYALKHCNPQRKNNIRMILKYLIPVKLSIGILPSDWLLQRHNLYRDVVLALRRGDLRLLRQALQEHEDRFLRSGVYLVLEKLELQVYQRLIKKIYIIQKQKDPVKAHQIKLEAIVKALKWLDMDMDIDEVECITANLIYKNLIKGYFAHKSKVAVLSKQDPFPKLTGKHVT
ncbi:unnamed protein product [Rhodiola kirilowii]